VLAGVHPTALVAVEYLPVSQAVHSAVPPMEYFPAGQSSQSASEIAVLAVMILVPEPQVLACVQPTALDMVEYLPVSQAVHSAVPPMEYFPAGQSSQSASEIAVLAVMILVPAPQVLAGVQPTAP